MIRDGSITYPSATSLLQNWHPENDFLFEFLVAICTTVLAYQVVWTVHDLFFGLRKPGEIRVSHLGILILVSELSSRLMIRFLASHRSGREVKPPAGVFVKVALLLLLTPIVRILTVALMLESNRKVSFREAQFGGISFGVADALIIEEKLNFFGEPVHVDYSKYDIPIAQFFTGAVSEFYNSTGFKRLQEVDEDDRTAILHLQSGDDETVLLSMETQSLRIVVRKFSELNVEGALFRVKKDVSVEQGRELLQNALSILLKNCPEDSNTGVILGSPPAGQPAPSGDGWDLHVILKCRAYNISEVNLAMHMVEASLALKDATNLNLVQIKGEQVGVELWDLPLLVRTSSFVSLPILCIITLGAIILRVLVKLVTNNDSLLCVETIIKDRVGAKCCDSLLQGENLVYYGSHLKVSKKNNSEDSGSSDLTID